MNSLLFIALVLTEGLFMVACRPGMSCEDKESGLHHVMGEVFVKRLDLGMSATGSCVVCHCNIYPEGMGFSCRDSLEPAVGLEHHLGDSTCYLHFYDVYVRHGTVTSLWDPQSGQCMLCTCVLDLFTKTARLLCSHRTSQTFSHPQLGPSQYPYADDLIPTEEEDEKEMESGVEKDSEVGKNEDAKDESESSGSVEDEYWSSGEVEWSSGMASGEPVHGIFGDRLTDFFEETSGALDENYDGSGEIPPSTGHAHSGGDMKDQDDSDEVDKNSGDNSSTDVRKEEVREEEEEAHSRDDQEKIENVSKSEAKTT